MICSGIKAVSIAIAQSLRAYCSKEQENWSRILPTVMMAFRMSPSTQSTQFSPYYMLFGKEMPLPIDTALIPEEIIDQAPDKFIDEVIKRVKTVHDAIITLGKILDQFSCSFEQYALKD
jgi:hypothetical protein